MSLISNVKIFKDWNFQTKKLKLSLALFKKFLNRLFSKYVEKLFFFYKFLITEIKEAF